MSAYPIRPSNGPLGGDGLSERVDDLELNNQDQWVTLEWYERVLTVHRRWIEVLAVSNAVTLALAILGVVR